MTLLWFRAEPVGICVFTTPPLSLRHRNRFFGLKGSWASLPAKARNAQLATLSRVVIHPAFRGAGIASAFIHRSCRLCPYPWIETLAQMGHINPFFEKAGFRRIGVTVQQTDSRESHSAIYGGNRLNHGKKTVLVSEETHRKSRYAQPIYYIFDNRQKHGEENRENRSTVDT